MGRSVRFGDVGDSARKPSDLDAAWTGTQTAPLIVSNSETPNHMASDNSPSRPIAQTWHTGDTSMSSTDVTAGKLVTNMSGESTTQTGTGSTGPSGSPQQFLQPDARTTSGEPRDPTALKSASTSLSPLAQSSPRDQHGQPRDPKSW